MRTPSFRETAGVIAGYAVWATSLAIVVATTFEFFLLPRDAFHAYLWNIVVTAGGTTLIVTAATGWYLRRLLVQSRDLQHANDHDYLTGLKSRAHFFREVGKLALQAELGGESLEQPRRQAAAVIALDLDQFKRVNDVHGHQAGDAVLIELARRLQAGTRGDDVVARFGGDECILFLPETDLAQALSVAERLRRSIGEAPVATKRGEISVTASFGVAAMGAGRALDDVLYDADQALLRAKAGGGNRVERARDHAGERRAASADGRRIPA